VGSAVNRPESRGRQTDSPGSLPGIQRRLRPGNRPRWRRAGGQHGGERPGQQTPVDLRYL